MKKQARVYVRSTVKGEDLIDIGIDLDIGENYYWLMESKESFHGEFDDGIFTIKDNRFEKEYVLPATMVKCEECDEVPNTTMNFMYCENCKEGLDEGLENMPKEPHDLYS